MNRSEKTKPEMLHARQRTANLDFGEQKHRVLEHNKWLGPSVPEAIVNANDNIFGNRKGSIWATKPMDFASLGTGVTLYFLLVKWFAILLFCQTIVSLPTIVFFSVGNGIPPQHLDPFGLSRTTLGNYHAYDVSAVLSNYHQVLANYTFLTTNSNSTQGLESTNWISYTISVLDLVNTLMFICFMYWLKGAITEVARVADRRFVTPSDYAVFIQGLPHDATKEQVRMHFDELYHLDRPDWTWDGLLWGRIGGKNARQPVYKKYPSCVEDITARSVELVEPVRNFSNTGDPMYSGSWVCEVSIAYSQNALYHHVAKSRKLAKQFERTKGLVQKYGSKNCYNQKKLDKAKKQLVSIERELVEQALLQQQEGGPEKHNCVGAFVTFKHQDSFQRCINDYRNCSRWWHSQPTKLQFNGDHELVISIAPEPTNIKWENIGIGLFEFWGRHVLSFLGSFMILLMGFYCVYFCQLYFKEFREQLPDVDACVIDLPAKYRPDYGVNTANSELLRIPERDKLCPSGDMIWLAYSSVSNNSMQNLSKAMQDPCRSPCIYHPVSSSRETTCYTKSVQEGCPSMRSPMEAANIDPVCAKEARATNSSYVITIADTIVADPDYLKIFLREVDSVTCCSPYNLEETMQACFCSQVLRNAIAKSGVLRAVGTMSDEELFLCGDYATNKVLAQVITVIPALIVVCVNVMIRFLVGALSKHERHITMTQQQVSIASKIFAAQFLNTAFVILILHAALPYGFSLLPDERTVGNHEDFDDFSREWYSVVGQAILISMILNIVTPHVATSFIRFVIKPLKKHTARFWAITQHDLDWAYCGQKFSIAVRYAVILNTIFVTLLYSANMPLVLPVGCTAMTFMYWYDKIAILRMYRKPPSFDDTFAKLASTTLPFALLGHTAVAYWSFGNADLMPSAQVNAESLDEFLGSFSIESDLAKGTNATLGQLYSNMTNNGFETLNEVGVFDRASRIAALPHFLLTVGILVWFFLYSLLHTLYSLPAIYQAFGICKRGIVRTYHAKTAKIRHKLGKSKEGRVTIKTNKVHVEPPLPIPEQETRRKADEFLLDEETEGCNPPYTEAYIRKIPRHDSDLENFRKTIEYEDLEHCQINDYHFCRWKRSGKVAGVPFGKGDLLKTWQLIAMQSVHSYSMTSNPYYK